MLTLKRQFKILCQQVVDIFPYPLRQHFLDAWYWARYRSLRRRYASEGKHRVALASFPRSGNTWLRSLLEEATGCKTGSIYDDKIEYLQGLSDGLVIKTHRCDAFRYTKAILVVRSPFDSIESYYAYRKDFDQRKPRSWHEHVLWAVNEWERHTSYWLKAPMETLVIRFEELKESPQKSLGRVLEFLGIELPETRIDEAIEACQIERLRKRYSRGQKFFRSGQVGSGKKAFSEGERRYLRGKLQRLMNELGYSSD